MPFNNEVNLGSRQVDTQQPTVLIPSTTIGALAVPKVLTPGLIDCSQSISFNLALLPVANFPSNTLEICILWFGPDGTTIVREKVYEINVNSATDGTWVTTNITDICLGSYAQVWMTGTKFNPNFTGTPQSVSGTFTASSRAVYKARITEMAVESPPNVDTWPMSTDGLLLFANGIGLAAGGSSGLFQASLSSEPVIIGLTGNGGQIRFRGGFGAAAAPPVAGPFNASFTLVTPAFLAVSTPTAFFGPYPAISRPLVFQLTNIGATAASGVSVAVWTAGN